MIRPRDASALLFASAQRPPRAQSAVWTDRGYVNISGWIQPTGELSRTPCGRSISPSRRSSIRATRPAMYAGRRGRRRRRLWRNLAVGVDVSRFSKTTEGAVSAQIPHPFFFNRARTVSGDARGLHARRDGCCTCRRSGWCRCATDVQLALAGGPSWFVGRAGSGQRRDDDADLSLRHRDVRQRGNRAPLDRRGSDSMPAPTSATGCGLTSASASASPSRTPRSPSTIL